MTKPIFAVALVAALCVSAMSAKAGGLAAAVFEPVIEAEPAGSLDGNWLVLLLILVIAAVARQPDPVIEEPDPCGAAIENRC